jgi:membrane protein implicated in regulation of membrane protease activity
VLPRGLLVERAVVPGWRRQLPSAVPHPPAASRSASRGRPHGRWSRAWWGLKGAASKSGGHISWFNASTLLAFLAWFGGVGYILTKHSHFVGLTILGFALLAGLFAGLVVFQFMARVVKATSTSMLDWDYRVEGTVGTVSMAIRENGTGEVIFEQNGARKSTGARSEDGTSLPKGAEVVIARYDDGIAYVKRWEEFTK